MKINFTRKQYASVAVASDLIQYLQDNEDTLGLANAELYYDFPLYKDFDGEVVISDLLLVSPQHGVITIGTSDVTSQSDVSSELLRADFSTEQAFTFLYSRLIRNKELRRTKTQLKFPADAILYAPFVDDPPENLEIETTLILNYKNLADYLNEISISEMSSQTLLEIISTIDGAKGMIRPQMRDISGTKPNSKGNLANKLEAEILSFDQRQKFGYMAVLDGPQRIRGLAGSGKTVVLAMKAALTHLRYPDANILYTFYTKSLYQHIQRLITRFYRQFDDRDPDWSKLKIRHAWGGGSSPGVYSTACEILGVPPYSFSEASRRSRNKPFEFVCSQLIYSVPNIEPIYDYIFADEGQDYPTSFLQLCVRLAKHKRVVWAYDDLQTIFQVSAPTPAEIFGEDEHKKPLVELSEDIILYKCYRNPREILVCAHALGLGLYGPQIVRMLENREHWEDIGYQVIRGDFTEGDSIVIERPAENSLSTISNAHKPSEIVQAVVYSSYEDELSGVAQDIKNDIDDGLCPDDILVAVVDDRNARSYLRHLARELALLDIRSNNIHEDSFSLKRFKEKEHVTLSTVHKAKGNEAYMVYVMGVDALFSPYAGVRERNILFTAMTRAKGWVKVSGIGESAEICKKEISKALAYFPSLKFTYPSQEQLKIMHRDLANRDVSKQKIERMLDQLLKEMSPEDIRRFIEQKSIRKEKEIIEI